MLKLMIVDDEYFVRKGIIESISWAEYDVEICGEASDGSHALSLLPDLRPDCILTDIRMGEMDGLSFIEEARKLLPDTIFVILSGYDDFEYARKAISLGVSEYLLKPVGAEELIKVIRKIQEKLRKNQEQEDSQNASIQNSVMLSFNTPRAELSIQDSYFRVFTFSVNNMEEFSSRNTALSSWETLRQQIPGVIQQYLDIAGINHIVKVAGPNLFVVMLNYRTPFAGFTRFLECFAEFLLSHTGSVIRTGCGEEFIGYHNINQSYNQAFAALALHYCRECGSIVYPREVPDWLLRNYMYNPALQNFKSDIRYFSRTAPSSPEQYAARLETFRQKMERLNLDEEDRITMLLKIFILVLNRLEVSADTIRKNSALSALLRGDKEEGSAGLFVRLEKLPGLIHDFLNGESFQSYQNIIDIVIKYVHQHYGENISLNLLSREVHVTPNYLSKVFKETVGENFKEWLTRYRITKAKELLMDPSLKTYEVAIMTGFSDYKHFASVFKKYTGYSAKEYRLSQLGRAKK